jgi:hypothetical protein
MRKHLFFIPALIAIAIIILPGCGKDKEDPPPQKTKTELLTTGTWKFSSVTWGGAPASQYLQACQTDNTAVFAAAGTGTLDEGATKCSAGDPQSRPFTWNFQTNESILFISATLFTGGNSTFNLVSLTENQLVVSQNVTFGSVTQLAVFTFVH